MTYPQLIILSIVFGLWVVIIMWSHEMRIILVGCFFIHMNMRMFPYALTNVCCLMFISQEIHLLGGMAELMNHARDYIWLRSLNHYLIYMATLDYNTYIGQCLSIPPLHVTCGLGNIHTTITLKFFKFFTKREDLRNVVQQNWLCEGWDNIFIQLSRNRKRTKKAFA